MERVHQCVLSAEGGVAALCKPGSPTAARVVLRVGALHIWRMFAAGEGAYIRDKSACVHGVGSKIPDRAGPAGRAATCTRAWLRIQEADRWTTGLGRWLKNQA